MASSLGMFIGTAKEVYIRSTYHLHINSITSVFQLLKYYTNLETWTVNKCICNSEKVYVQKGSPFPVSERREFLQSRSFLRLQFELEPIGRSLDKNKTLVYSQIDSHSIHGRGLYCNESRNTSISHLRFQVVWNLTNHVPNHYNNTYYEPLINSQTTTVDPKAFIFLKWNCLNELVEGFFIAFSQRAKSTFDQLENWILKNILLADPEIFMTVGTMMEHHGYPVESYEVQTEDGYLLTLIRIPGSKNVAAENVTTEEASRDGDEQETLSEATTVSISKEDEKVVQIQKPKPAVLIVHGFQCQGSNWFLNSPEKILPYKLADAGFDCWVANLRGTKLSKKHISLRISSKQFWEFSWHEMGIYDYPAMINYILDISRNESLYIIAHSMGCSAFFAGMSTETAFCSKIKAMVALSPAVYGKFCRNKPTKFVAPMLSSFGKLKSFRQKEISSKTFAQLAKSICPPFKSPEQVGGWIGSKYGRFFGGFGNKQVEKTLFAKLAGEFPSSTSAKAMCHGMQCVASKQFLHYDYGRSENLKRYGQATPPPYDLKRVTVPVATFYSEGDELCTTLDVTQLSKDLPNSIGNYGVTIPGFSHGDFMLGRDADKLVYNQIIQIFQRYEGKFEDDKKDYGEKGLTLEVYVDCNPVADSTSL